MTDFCSDHPVKKTRGDHTCCWCGETIPSDSPAKRWAGRHNGDFWSGYMHPECDAAYMRTDNDELDDGWNEGEFRRGMTPSESGKAERAELEAERMESE